jgi:50S ribosomal protein L16 3-hydroxylase
MMYDDRCIYLNGESFRASGRDGRLMRRLADTRCLEPRVLSLLSDGARDLVHDWLAAGWLHAAGDGAGP